MKSLRGLRRQTGAALTSISPESLNSPASGFASFERNSVTRLWNAEGVTMENLIRAKIDQMWQIATSDACGKHSSAVADLHREISKLLQKLEPSQLEEN